MTTFTADDFAKARFATRGNHCASKLAQGQGGPMWTTAGGAEFTDGDMARCGWVPVRETTPVSLDALRTAWENADDWGLGDPIRKGDTVIVRNPDPEEFSVFTWPGHGYTPDEETRVLSRKSREPWADLADDLKRFDWDMTPHVAAQEMYEAGWRKTGGDES